MEAFHTKYRPVEFEDVVDQPSIVRILKRQIESRHVGKGYLFAGPSGCGKTTLAYIVAAKIDGELIEIDVAANNSVDSTRDIVRAAEERSVTKQKKVFLLDECQMYSTAAWQPLLKVLERDLEHTIFIFCTTDPQKVPQTILTRVQRFNLNRASTHGICDRLRYICQCEGLQDFEGGIEYISRISGGSPRQAISTLEKCAGYSRQITLPNVLEAIGSYSYDVFFDLINACIDGREVDVVRVLHDSYEHGVEAKLFVDQFISFCLDVNKFALFGDCSLTQFPTTLTDQLSKCTNFNNATSYYQYVLDKLLNLKNMLKTDPAPQASVEIVLLQVARCA